MPVLPRLASLWRNLTRGPRVERDLDEEMRAALDVLIAEKVRAGMPLAAARRAASLDLGIELVKERVRDVRSGSALTGLARDVSYACRLMARQPVFTVVAVLTLASGIGANTAMFTLVDAILIKSLPVERPEQLVAIDVVTDRGRRQNLSHPLFERMRDGTRSFSGVFAALDGITRMSMIGPEPGREPEEVGVQLVSYEYFDVLGVRPYAGSFLSGRAAGADAVAVLSYDFWMRRFGADPRVLGQRLVVKGQPLTISGIAPDGFFGDTVGRAPDVWTPLTMQPGFDRGRSMLDLANVGWLKVVARLAPGATVTQAEADLALLRGTLQSEFTDLRRYLGSVTFAVSDASRGLPEFRDRFSLPLRVLTGVVGLVLLVACANVANLLLARAAARRQEMSIRIAIGAGRHRLVRQLVTESVVLALIGGALGVFLAWGGSHLLLVIASSDNSVIPIDVTPNVRVLAFTSALSLGTVVIFGVIPAEIGSRLDVGLTLKSGGRALTQADLSRTLVVAQVALSVVLLTGAGLYVQTLRNLRTRDVGYAAAALLEIRVSPETSGYGQEQLLGLTRRITERLGGIPGVQAVSVAHAGFGSGISTTCCIAVEGYRHEAGEDRMMRVLGVAPAYFRTMRLPIVRGREFTDPESARNYREPVASAIVNDAFVRRYLDGRDAVGARVGWGEPPNVRYDITIVGVARDAIHADLRQDSQPLVYVPSLVGDTFIVRTGQPPASVVPALRQAMGEIDRNLDMEIRTMSAAIDEMVVREKLLSRLSTAFGALALVLAAIGLYGLTSYAVLSRTRDIGIRMALGAARHSVLGLELHRALRLVLFGVVAGVPLAMLAARAIRGQFFGVSATDPATIATVAAVLFCVTGAAAFIPARRASRVDPIVALRYE